MMGQILARVSLPLLLLSPGLSWGQDSSPTALITGTVAYRQRISLPPEATVNLRLEDVWAVDAPATTVAETTFATEGKQVPLPFQLTYNPAQIQPTHRYNLRATISAQGQMLFTTTTANPVITRGAPSQVDLVLEQVTPPSQPPATAPTGDAELEGTYWKLTVLGGTAVPKPVGGTEAYLILHANDKRIAGSTGCNRLVGGYELNGDSLRFTPAGMTLMACPSALMKQEQRFTSALKAVTGYRIEGRKLELLNGDTVEARFQARYLK